MISNGKELYAYIDTMLIPLGYIRKKDTYYLSTPECICFFSIGKSEFGGRYEELMGCFLREILKEKNEFPPYYKNHLKYVIDYFVDKDLVRRVFDLENKEFVGNQREHFIKEFIELYVIPFLNDVSTKEGIKQAVVKYEELKYVMKVSLKSVLGMSIDN